MSDMHVITGDGDRNWSVVLHIPVPNANNSVSVNWRTALINSGMGGTTRLPDADGTEGTISAAEKTQIEAGELYEHSVTTEIDGQGVDNASRIAAMRAMYTAESARVTAFIQRRLKFFGYTLEES
jgi:hypothetical protein